MVLYHLGKSLNIDMKLIPDYKSTKSLVIPLVKTLEIRADVFNATMLNARYFREVMRKSNMREWSDCSKWGTEAIFEYIRMTEFKKCYSRIFSNFFYESIDMCKNLFKRDYEEPGDDDGTIFIYEIDVDDENYQRYDMEMYDIAYEKMENLEDIEIIKNIARRYWKGECTQNAVIECLSDKKATVKRVIDERLRI